MNTSKDLPIIERFDFNKHLPQTSAEKTSDLFYILSTLYFAERGKLDITRLTLEKTLFKTVEALAEDSYSFLNTFFFINTLGPHNNMFYNYFEELEKAGLIEVEKKSIYLTAKGLRVISELIEEASQKRDLKRVLIELAQKAEGYADDPDRAIKETHSQKIVDTTDKNKVKTIEELINEIKPEQKFETGSQFKYVNPFTSKRRAKKIDLPSAVLNKLESVIAEVEDIDFIREEDIRYLYL